MPNTPPPGAAPGMSDHTRHRAILSRLHGATGILQSVYLGRDSALNAEGIFGQLPHFDAALEVAIRELLTLEAEIEALVARGAK